MSVLRRQLCPGKTGGGVGAGRPPSLPSGAARSPSHTARLPSLPCPSASRLSRSGAVGHSEQHGSAHSPPVCSEARPLQGRQRPERLKWQELTVLMVLFRPAAAAGRLLRQGGPVSPTAGRTSGCGGLLFCQSVSACCCSACGAVGSK